MAGEQDQGTAAAAYVSDEMNPNQHTAGNAWPQSNSLGLNGKGNPPTNSGTALGSFHNPPDTDDIPDTNILDPSMTPTGGKRAEGT